MNNSTRRHITVAVTNDLYRQTRRLAAQYDTTVTVMLTYLILLLPQAVKAVRYPGGAPQFQNLRLSIVTPSSEPASQPSPEVSAVQKP